MESIHDADVGNVWFKEGQLIQAMSIATATQVRKVERRHFREVAETIAGAE